MEHRISLLTIYDLIEPIEDLKTIVDKVLNPADPVSTDEFSLDGKFVLLMAALEEMLSRLITAFLKEHPERLPKEQVSLDRRQLLSHSTTKQILDEMIEQRARGVLNGSWPEAIVKACSYLTIPRFGDESAINELGMLKVRRNDIMHPQGRRAARWGGILSNSLGDQLGNVDSDFLTRAAMCVATVAAHFEREVKTKYACLTRLHVLRELWNHMFPTPIMPFDDFWQVNEEEDRVTAAKPRESQGGMSSSEWRLYQLWLGNFRGQDSQLVMRSLSSTDKLFWFMERLQDIWLY